MAGKRSVTKHLIVQSKEAPSHGPVKPLKEARDAFVRMYLVNVLELCKGRVSEAARLAGKCRADFYDLLRKHNLSPDDFRKWR